MPDPTRQSVSASQAAALFGVSPYTTRMALYHWLRDGTPIDDAENERMTIGKLLEDDILTLVQDRYHLDVNAVEQAPESYVRHPEHPVGCTLDAWTSCPTRGRAVVESKNVDTKVFYADWTLDEEGELIAAPPDIELQVQTEMLVAQADWAIIAAFVGGNRLECIERKPNRSVQERIAAEARALLEQVRTGDEPPAQGAIDYEVIRSLLPATFAGARVDMRGDTSEESYEVPLLGQRYNEIKAQRLDLEKEEEALKGRLLDVARRIGGDSSYIMFDEGSLKPSRGKDTYYRLPPEVGFLIEAVRLYMKKAAQPGKTEGAFATLDVAIHAVLGLTHGISRKGSVKVTWKDFEG